MKKITVIHLGDGEESSTLTFLGQEIQIRRIGCHGDAERVRAVIAEHDGEVDAIGLEGYPAELELGGVRVAHEVGAALAAAAIPPSCVANPPTSVTAIAGPTPMMACDYTAN